MSQSLGHLFSKLQKKNILVAGDFILDRYTFGSCKRISPEAPVPVVCVSHEEEKAGGAGNVVVNLRTLGMNPIPFGRVGSDAACHALIQVLQNEKIDTQFLIQENDFQTPLKVRLIAGGQQLNRIDYEKPKVISQDTESYLLKIIPEMLVGIDLVAISDYAKGFLTEKVLSTLILQANALGIPVISDPKGTELSKYAGSTILKPNLSEAYAAAPNLSSLSDVAEHILQKAKVDVLMITRSEAGISLFYPDGSQVDHPVQPREVKDVTGAGDTVLAVLASAIANGIDVSSATQLANVAAQVAVARLGCARVSLSEIARAIVEHHAHDKIFDEAHFPALKQALKPQDFVVLTVDAKSELSAALLKAVRQAANSCNKEMVVALSGACPDEELVSGLASLRDVSYVLLAGENCKTVLSELSPHQILHI